MDKYDCTKDVFEHRFRVRYWLLSFAGTISMRGETHDESKLHDPEKSIFDIYTPLLKSLEFGSEEYKTALAGMGDGLKHHYQTNRHHPEHFENGINGMTLYDLVEMFCDWLAAAEKKQNPVDIGYLTKRFNIDPQLANILMNTLQELGK